MKKTGSLALSLAFVAALGMGFTGCGSDDAVDAFDDAFGEASGTSVTPSGTPGTAIFVYQHTSQEVCDRMEDVGYSDVSVDVLEYSNTNKTCEDYGRVSNYAASIDDSNVCVEYDLGTSSGGSCVVNADMTSSYRTRSYTIPAEIADTLINQ